MLIKNQERELSRAVLLHGPKILDNCLADLSSLKKYFDKVNSERLRYPLPQESIDTTDWMIPTEYKNLDIEAWLIDTCPKENLNRLIYELSIYKKNNMIPVLQTMKYIVDTLRKHSIIWGVGRGSSVASYVLFLIGIHKIDSVKYNLPIEEFFKGEQNG